MKKEIEKKENTVSEDSDYASFIPGTLQLHWVLRTLNYTVHSRSHRACHVFNASCNNVWENINIHYYLEAML